MKLNNYNKITVNLNKKLYFLLEDFQRKTACLIFVMMLVTMALEMIGVGILVPIISLISKNDVAQQKNLLPDWCIKFVENIEYQNIVYLGLLAITFVFFAKSFFLGLFAWTQSKFISNLQSNISRRLFARYLSQSYQFHLRQNSSELIRNCLTHAASFGGLIQQTLLLISEAFVAIGMVAMLLLVEPIGAVTIGSVLGVFGWFFNYANKKRILMWGAELQFHESRRMQYLQEGFGAIKDVKLLGMEQNLLKGYEIHNAASAEISKNQNYLQALPRLWLELMAVLGVVGVIAAMMLQGKSQENLLPTLGLFAAVAFRLMPSINRILNALQTMRFSIPMVDTLYKELIVLDEPKKNSVFEKKLFLHEISLKNLNFSYENNSHKIINNINIVIKKGDIIGIVGESGGGKSTLIDIILGLLAPTSGGIFVDSIDIKKNIRGWQNNIGYVPQSIYLTDDTIRKNIAFGLPEEDIRDDLVSESISDAQLSKFITQLPDGMNTVVGERGVRLSGGQRQRIGIARALYRKPEVLVLDEATSSLDNETELSVMKTILALKGKITILIVAHRLSTVTNCNLVYRISPKGLDLASSL